MAAPVEPFVNDAKVSSTNPLPVTATAGTTDTLVGAVNETAPASDTASSGLNGRLQRIAQRITSLIALLPASLGAKTSAASLSVVPASDASFALTAASLQSTTATRASVNSGASSVTIIASNASRRGVSVYNSDANPLYLDMSGGTAATTRCQYAVASGQTFEAPFGFTGAITGIWGADGSGVADVVEFT